ncbi:MAG: YceI family protein [Bacteroidetes bacterium]|jgi:polyisoprenoid-binding protein YceI|nr:YceI family protein [Bacteroidota bacterium]
MIRSIFAFVLAVGLTATAAAQSAWTLDKSHSGVKFSVRHMVISDVEGSFKDYDVTFKSEKEDFSDAVIEATIKSASINTDNESRDGHLKSDDFFNAEKYPTITFKSNKVEKTGATTYKFYGDLTIRDVTKPVVFEAVNGGTVKTQRGTVSGWKATTTINRFDYNLKWTRAIETGGLVVGSDVTITVNAQVKK